MATDSTVSATDPLVCERCGDYARLNRLWGRLWCGTCLARRDPIELDPPSALTLVKHTLALAVRIAKPALLLTLLFGIPQALLAEAGLHGTTWSFLYSMTIGSLGTAALQRLGFLHIVRPEQARLGIALREAVRNFGSLLAARLLATFFVGLWGLLLVVPGLLRLLSYAMVTPLVMNEGCSPARALALSRERMAGHRQAALLAYLLLASPMLALVFAIAFENFLRMRHGLPALFGTTSQLGLIPGLFALLVGIPLDLVGAVLHLKLTEPRRELPRPGQDRPSAPETPRAFRVYGYGESRE